LFEEANHLGFNCPGRDDKNGNNRG